MLFQHPSLLLFSLLPTPVFSSTLARRGDAEHVTLMNCYLIADPGNRSSQMAYFASEPSSKPFSVAHVGAEPGRSRVWEGGISFGTFPDSVTFYSQIEKMVDVGEFAGVGKNDYVGFTCWRREKKALYDWEGKRCDMVYDCDHSDLPEDAYIKTVSLAQSSFGPILAVGGEKTQTITSNGQTKTVKVTTASAQGLDSPTLEPTPTPTSPSNPTTESAASRSTLQKPTIIGIAVGSIGGFLFILGAAFFLWRRRRHDNDGGEEEAVMEMSTDSEVKAELAAEHLKKNEVVEIGEGRVGGCFEMGSKRDSRVELDGVRCEAQGVELDVKRASRVEAEKEEEEVRLDFSDEKKGL